MIRNVFVILCCVLALTSCIVVQKGYRDAELKAREDSLKSTLSALRDVIREYTLNEGQPPQKLENIVERDYINLIPEDPITKRVDWVVDMYNCPPQSSCKEGVKDVHSASKEKSTRGDLYSEW